ncbi:diguanylate cyclase [Candidatus Desantisbacteria bacterium]|nr:diguanylate cyclase [Candidatus Desantisbacteria bacterium]
MMAENTIKIGIIVLDEDGHLYRQVKKTLSNDKFNISIAKNFNEAKKLLKNKYCEIIINEAKKPGIDDIEIIKHIKEKHSDYCIIVTSGYNSIDDALNTLKAGAYDFIPKPFDNETIRIILNKAIERQTLLKERNKFLELSRIDGLTEIFNQRHFNEILSVELNRSGRFKHHLSLLLIDIDDFKLINDSYGHLTGDKILKKFSKILLENVRTIDFVCRYGGDEFAIVLPETSKEGAYNLSRRLRGSISKNNFDVVKEKGINFQSCIGISTFPQDGKTKEELFEKADRALYDAKKLGKGHICFFSHDENKEASILLNK